jgi:hypothetical protein
MARSQALIQQTDDRWSKRFRLLLDARAELDGLGATPVTIHDLSDTGLLLETRADLQEGAQLMLEIEGYGSVAAQVVWRSSRFFGARFAAPLAPSGLTSLHSKSKVVWPEFKPAPTSGQPTRREPLPLPSPALAQTGGERQLPVATRIQLMVAISLGLWGVILASGWSLLH